MNLKEKTTQEIELLVILNELALPKQQGMEAVLTEGVIQTLKNELEFRRIFP